MSQFAPFEPDACYHLYNHAVGDEDLFRTAENYRYFMDRCVWYTQGMMDIHAYCMMPNHFHFLIKIKPYEVLKGFFEGKSDFTACIDSKAISNQIGQQLGNWFNAYARAYNKRFNRRGRLFIERVRRKKVVDDAYMRQLVAYIHWNPVHHGFVAWPEDWMYSSYRLGDQGLFGDEQAFARLHREVEADSFFDDMEPF
ncbi:MAG: hypothetical protein AAF564_09620 [Bacteroidota bacterium]